LSECSTQRHQWGARALDNGFADIVLATAAGGYAPDFEMPAGTGNDTGEVSSSGHPTSRDMTPRGLQSTPDDHERARQSSLFPVMEKPSDGSPSERPASDRTAAGEQKNDAQAVSPSGDTEKSFIVSSLIGAQGRN
jgi:hypothetical protein